MTVEPLDDAYFYERDEQRCAEMFPDPHRCPPGRHDYGATTGGACCRICGDWISAREL